MHLFVTDLSDAEIVLGTLGARLAPIVGLIVCGVPVTALAAMLGGVDFGTLVGAFAVSTALAVLGCVLALALSVRVTKMHEVLMAVYTAEGLWLLSLPIWWGLNSGGWIPAPPVWFQLANPYVIAFAPYSRPGTVGVLGFGAFVVGVLALSAALTGLMVARLRGVIVAESGKGERGAPRRRLPDLLGRVFPSWPTPTLDGNPVLWREWHRNRPSRLARGLWAVLVGVTWALAAFGTVETIRVGEPDGADGLELGLIFCLMFGLLLLSATSPTAMAEERARGSLDVLIATPMSTRAIVSAKWWGMFRRVLVLLPLPLYVGIIQAAMTPDVYPAPASWANRPVVPLTLGDRLLAITLCPADFLASGALLVSLGLILAIWVRRIGRAVTLSVILFFLIGFVWPFLVRIGFEFLGAPIGGNRQWIEDHRWVMQSVAALSPVFGPAESFQVLGWYQSAARPWQWLGLGIALVCKAAAAWGLFWLSIRTFDRRMGRVPEARTRGREPEPVVLEAVLPGTS